MWWVMELQNILEEFKKNKDIKVNENKELELTIIFQEQACDISKFTIHLYPQIQKYSNLEELFLGLCKKLDNPSYTELEQYVYTGLLLLYQHGNVYLFDLSRMPSRSASDSSADPESTYGSRDGFVENYKDNIALIRSRLKCNNLNITDFMVGRRSKTFVGILSIEDIHNKDMLKRIKKQVDKIDVDAILSVDDFVSYFQQRLKLPVFQYLGNPDLACRKLYQGEFIIIIDRIPVVLCIPTTISLATRFRADEVTLKVFAYLERIVVLIAMFASTMFLALLASFVTFQNDCLSLLVLSILKVSQKTVIFPIAIEIFIVLGLFELYHLIGYRQPKSTISGTVVLIGGLIIGQNMMESGIAGVFIIAFTALAFLTSFVVSSNVTTVFAISIARLFLLLCASFYGLFGFVCAAAILGYFAYKQQIFGVAYFHPFVPLDIGSLVSFFRPTTSLSSKKRASTLKQIDKTRRSIK